METDNIEAREQLPKHLTDLLIRVGLMGFLLVMCVRILMPFMGLILWALILAVTLYPLHKRLAKRLGGSQGRAATLLVLVCVVAIGLPTILLGSSFAGFVHEAHATFENNTFHIPPPAPSVEDWPLIGESVHRVWTQAATDLPALLEKLQPQLMNFSKSLLSMAAGMAGDLLMFLGSLVIAGIMLAYGESGSAAMLAIIRRMAGPEKAGSLHSLSTATIRSVATGVIGVAFIQAVLLGGGFMAAGIPAAGMLAVLVLLLGIAQLPALLISLPAIGYLWWSGDSTVMNIVFTVYLLVAGMADNVLKPLLLGRGVEAPMPVILLGALGGMVSGGLIGLFLGAVLLALGYQLFMAWVAEAEPAASEPIAPEAADARPAGE